MMLFIKDLLSAVWAWLTVWFVSVDIAERRRTFVETGIDKKRLKKFPANLWLKAYNKRLKQNNHDNPPH